MNIRQAIGDKISGDAAIAALLDSYAGAPAVFAPQTPPAYEFQVKPAVIVRSPTALDDLTAFSGNALSRALLTVSLYSIFPPNSSSDAAIESAANAIRALFRAGPFRGTDGITYQPIVSGPIAAPVSAPEMIGRSLQLQMTIGG